MSDEQMRRLRGVLEGARRTASRTSDAYLEGVRDGLAEALEILMGQP